MSIPGTPSHIQGIHHITAISGPARKNYEFYTGVMGLRFVKKTVNFDDPFTYHLYYGNYQAMPGSSITFFPWQHVVQGAPKTGETVDTQYSVPTGSLGHWKDYLASKGVVILEEGTRFGHPFLSFKDPDQLLILLVEEGAVDGIANQATGDVNDAMSIRGFFGATLDVPDIGRTAELLKEFGWSLAGSEGAVTRYHSDTENHLGENIDLVQSVSGAGRFGKGSIHHIAFRVATTELQEEWRQKLIHMGYQPTVAQERFYFRSIYFREKGGVLFEIATDEPGFTADEPLDELGSSLKLPPWYEPHRGRIEEALPDLV